MPDITTGETVNVPLLEALYRARIRALEAEIERLQVTDPGILEQLAKGIQAGPGWNLTPDEIDPGDLIGWAQ